MAKKDPKTVLITGSEGFVGSHLTKALQEALYKVECTCRPLTATKREACIPLDILNYEMIKDVMATYTPDIVVHLAAITSVGKSLRDPIRTYTTNVIGTVNLIEACRVIGKPVRFVHVSSSEVYGGGTSCGETDEVVLRNPIAVSKYAAELIIQNTTVQGLEYIIMRPFSNTGPGHSEDFVLPTIAKQVAEIEQNKRPPLLELGDIEVVREFNNIVDIASAYHLAIEKCRPGELYNVASGKGHSVADALTVFRGLSKVDFEVKVAETKLRKDDIHVLVGNGTKFISCTGWKPRIPFEKTIEDMLNYWRAKV
ncbi:GDP-mannose 4,6-dehydratase [candidate division WOR-3 bacterium]|nr:GDP-mannose 4,6-dehydratase [candidate division WOR-3 bacterium]